MSTRRVGLWKTPGEGRKRLTDPDGKASISAHVLCLLNGPLIMEHRVKTARPVSLLRIGLILTLVFGASPSLGAPRHQPLAPIGPATTAAPIIRQVVPGTLAATEFQVGDRIVALDGVPVASIDDFVQRIFRGGASSIAVERAGSQLLDRPVAAFQDPATGRHNALFIAPDENFTRRVKSLAGRDANGAMVAVGRISGTIVAGTWSTKTTVVEVEVALSVPIDCTDCSLKDAFLMDWTRRAWLAPVALENVAAAVFPEKGRNVDPIAVPPPRVVASNATTNVSGTYSGSTYGSTASGRISGTATTTTTPVYDYSGQYAAFGHNLGAAIRNGMIARQNKKRSEFVLNRAGNLRSGVLNPGEQLTGHLFFAVPRGFAGPYMVILRSSDSVVGTALFESPATAKK